MHLAKRFLAVAAVAMLGVGGLLVQPASAATGSPSYRTITNQWATGTFTVVRKGWSVSVTAKITDNKAGNCVYAKAEIRLDNGIDPDKHVVDNCNGKGTSLTSTVTLTPGSLGGTGYSSIELWACESNAFTDSCTSAVITVYQNNAINPGYAGQMATYRTESMAAFQNHKAQRPAPFDWNDNGCSSPINVSSLYNFNQACQRHDFGYRNYGHGLTVNPTDSQRATVDSQFLSDMNAWCNANKPTAGCYSMAGIYYGAVRQKGGPSFF